MTPGSRRRRSPVRAGGKTGSSSITASARSTDASSANAEKRAAFTRVHIADQVADVALSLGPAPTQSSTSAAVDKAADLATALQAFELRANDAPDIELEACECYKAVREALLVLKLCFCYLRPACKLVGVGEHVKQTVRYTLLAMMTLVMGALVAQVGSWVTVAGLR